MRFLHISDLHFGFDKGETAIAKRHNYMESLLEQIQGIVKERAIDYIFITGDIGWHANKSDYETALAYIRELIEKCQVSPKRVFICPGNHDVDRNAIADKAFPVDQTEANRWLNVERLSGYLEPCFSEYSNFCRELGVEQYRIGSQSGYLVGSIETEDIRVIALNSAWYAQSENVKDKMWVGANFLQVIKKDCMTNSNRCDDGIDELEKRSKLTIALVHHPSEKWHEEETHNFQGKVNAFKYLCDMSEIILTGHTHEIECGIRYQEGALITSTGSIYSDSTYNNAFYLYEVTSKGIEREQYFYYGNGWRTTTPEEISGGKIYHLERGSTSNTPSPRVYLEFDKRISSISYKSIDDCVLKWYRTDIRGGFPIYPDIDSNERALNLMSQFVCYDGKDVKLSDLFEMCLSSIARGELIVVRGTQGTGKSTIMSMLYIMALNRFRSQGTGAYPIYMDTHKYITKDTLGNIDELTDDLEKLEKILKNAQCKQYVIFVDGIDEYVSDSYRYEQEIYEKLVLKYEDRIVLCMGRIEDVDANRRASSQFSNLIDDGSMIIETKSIQVNQENVEGVINRFTGVFNYRLRRASKTGLARWIKQYSGGVIDFRTMLMLLNIATNDECSVQRALALNLQSYLMSRLNLSENDMGTAATTAVAYMMGNSIPNRSMLSARLNSIIHRNKIIRDYLCSYYFVSNLVNDNTNRNNLSHKLIQISNWNVVFPRTVCRFIRDLIKDRTKEKELIAIQTLGMMYEQASQKMKINIGYILGRIDIDKELQKKLLLQYIETVDSSEDFSLYRTLAISLIYLQHKETGEVYTDLLMSNPHYALKHLQLHFKYCYDNCDYISNEGGIEGSKNEVVCTVIRNTKQHILEILSDTEQRRNGGVLATDVITFCSALIVSAIIDVENNFLNEAQNVRNRLSGSAKATDKMKKFVGYMVYAYEMQLLSHEFSEG